MLSTKQVDRLFVVKAVLCGNVYGFVAATEKVENGLVHFKPVCDVVALVSRTKTMSDGAEFFADYTKRSADGLLWMFLREAGRYDEDTVMNWVPTIGEDVTSTI